jgi:hypothetical protein
MSKTGGPEAQDERPPIGDEAPARVSPASETWLAYYAAAQRGAVDREAEQARRTQTAGVIMRVVAASCVTLAVIGYLLLR